MKKFGVIHHSDEFIFGPYIKRFDTEKEAEQYVKNYVTEKRHHSNDDLHLFEIKKEYGMNKIDETVNGALYGFKERK